MAKRRYSKKGNKIEPSVLTLSITTASVTPLGIVTQYLDLSQVASLVNRRFYRQGINWAVAGIKVLNLPGFTGQIQVSKLPNTWTMSNSWEKGMRAWSKMNREAMSEAPSIRPKFLDFKIYADADHHTAGYAANLLPVSHSGTATAGEWVASKVIVPFGPASPGNTSEFEFIAAGVSYPGAGASGLNAVSLIEGYAASRGLPQQPDPNTPADAADADGSTPENWLTAMFNDGTDQDSEVIENLRTDNNEAPYPFSGDAVGTPDTMYPGGANQLPGLEIHSFEFITPTTIGGTTRIKGGNFPCGLIRFDMSNTGEANSLKLEIDLIPGPMRGYLCEPMTEM